MNNKYKSTNNDKCTYIHRNNTAHTSTTASTSASSSQPLKASNNQGNSQMSSIFLNRNKNPAFSGVKDSYYQSRFNFYNNTHLLNKNNHSATGQSTANSNQPTNNSPTSTTPNSTTINKSAILSHLNLNIKAKEELEKRKLAAKAEANIANEEDQSPNNTDTPEKLNNSLTDNTPAIPITSYSSYTNNDEDESDDDENDNAEMASKKINFDLKKRKLDVIKNVECSKKLKKRDIKLISYEEGNEDEDTESSYFNVFNSKISGDKVKNTNAVRSKQTITMKTNVKKQPILKQPILKQPILKSGQTQKDRSEIVTSFIGPKLPSTENSIPLSNSTEIIDQGVSTVANHNPDDISNSSNHSNTTKSIVSPKPVAENSPSNAIEHIKSSEPSIGPKINYTKDELAKYGDLSMMSQAYAKINQVSVVNFAPNGSTEINMVELDKKSHNIHEHDHIINNATLIQNQVQDKQNNDQFLEAYQDQQNQNAMKFHLQSQHRSIQMQMQNIHQLRANQSIQQLNDLHSMQMIQNHQSLQAQQKQQMIAMQLEQMNLLKQQQQMKNDTSVKLEMSDLSNLIAPHDVIVNTEQTKEILNNSQVVERAESVQNDQHVINYQLHLIETVENNREELQATIAQQTPQVNIFEEKLTEVPIQQANINIQNSTSQSPKIIAQHNGAILTNSPENIQQSFYSMSNKSPLTKSPANSPTIMPIQQQHHRLQYQPIQFLQNSQNNLLHLPNNLNQGLINLQHLPQSQPQIQLNGAQFVQPQYEQNPQITILNAHQLAAIQQNQLQQQLHVQSNHHQQQQQQLQQQLMLQQNNLQLQYHQPNIGFNVSQQPINIQPQLIQLRPNLAPAQPQFLVNSNQPFYQVLPQ